MKRIVNRIVRIFSACILAFVLVFSGFPSQILTERVVHFFQDRNVVDLLYRAQHDRLVIDKGFVDMLRPDVSDAEAAQFSIQTGYYMGNGAAKSISGLGFTPELVLLKPNTAAGTGALWKTDFMPSLGSSYFIATADLAAGDIAFEDDGFRVTGSNTDTVNVGHSWVAFGGSDCTASGTFCVGAFTGNGTASRLISTGFDPDLVWVKRSTAVGGSWRTTSMGANDGQYFAATTQDTTGTLFSGIGAGSGGFTVGATNNTNAGVYYFAAFKAAANYLSVGSYTGNGTTQSITGPGFLPDFVLAKNANAGVAVGAVFSTTESSGDNTGYFSDTANVVGGITSLDASGFSVGSQSVANGSGNTVYYAAFGGASDTRNTSGTYTYANGTYTGDGAYQVFAGLDFAPDLVIIKGVTTQAGVFRTSLMGGDSSAYLDAATANLSGAIMSMNANGFTIGNSATVNSSGVTYYWQAFGNAWTSETNSGAADFYIGAYYGNGVARSVDRLPFQADLLAIKRSGATGGVFTTSSHTSGYVSYFAATADATSIVSSIDSDGFTLTNSGTVNTAANYYWYFGFDAGSNFAVGTYSGNGTSQNISSLSFQPEYLWIKSTGAVRGVQRSDDAATDSVLPFINVSTVSSAVTGITTTGFSLGNASETNASGTNNYHYVAWNTNATQGSAAPYDIQTGYYMGNGGSRVITGLGFTPEVVLLKPDTTAGTGGVFKGLAMAQTTTPYFSATTDATAGQIILQDDGFTVVSSNANTANVGHSWVAFAGSDCSSSGVFCAGTFIGTGTASRLIPTGFDPDFVLVKRSTAVAASWRSSSMGANDGQYFAATTQDTTGTLFSGIGAGSGGFTVGATNNASSGVYYYLAFKGVAGQMSVGSYTGNGTSQSVTGPGFRPNFVLVKNANAGTAVGAVYNTTHSQGDNSMNFADLANIVGGITSLDASGFSVGTQAATNGSGNTLYYAAFGGASTATNTSGTYTYASGTYTGNGAYQTIDGVGFSPSMVIIKGAVAQAGVFRTASMSGDSTAYLDAATANFAGGITSINRDGFTLGTSVVTNTSGTTYYWEAFGNAWTPETNSGAADFYIGAYYGNGVARSVDRLPFQADLLAVKRSGATGGVFTTSSHTSGYVSYFAATADAASIVSSVDSDGFTLTTSANVNTAANTYWYFGFDAGSGMTVGTYSGNGTTQSVSVSPSITPEYLWIKSTGAVRGVQRSDDAATDSVLPFINVSTVSSAVTGITTTGFSLGNASETNASGTNNYHYVVWGVPYVPGTLSVDIVDGSYASVASPTFAMDDVAYSSSCQTATGTFGAPAQRIYIVNANGADNGWTLTVSGQSTTSVWDSTGVDYDFNDASGSGCSDGADADAFAGQMTLDPSSSSLATGACGSCTTGSISLGSSASFSEGVTDSITLLSASGSSDNDGDWVLTGIPISQTIPAEQAVASDYDVPMVLTITAN